MYCVKCNYWFVRLQFHTHTHTQIYTYIHMNTKVRSKMLQLNYIFYSGEQTGGSLVLVDPKAKEQRGLHAINPNMTVK